MMLKVCLFVALVAAIELPESCKPGQFYNTALMTCATCDVNVSLVTSDDGFGCTCEANSVPVSRRQCKRCGGTEVVSADGASCVPRRCQKDAAGRMACRKCPADYISVTQNYDGSPLREVQCVKCARGYRADGNRCVRCATCTCPKDHLVIVDECLPKPFVVDRPKYVEVLLHPNKLLEVVKLEYFCTMGDSRACNKLANACVKSFYSSDHGGACRLWLSSSTLPRPPDLPPLAIDPFSTDGKRAGEVQLSSNTTTIKLIVAAHSASGGMRLLREQNGSMAPPCLLPRTIRIGQDITAHCTWTVTDWELLHAEESLSPYLYLNGDFKPVPVSIRKPSGNIIQAGEWSANKYRRYFLIDTSISGSGINNTVHLRKLTTYVRIQRDKTKTGQLSVYVSLEAQYATKSALADSITIMFEVISELPSAGVLKSLEIWGGLLGVTLALYSLVQWRGCLRRGGPYISLLPNMSGCVADALYFAALFSTLHALAVEAGTLGLTLPLGSGENHTITSLIYAALSLKILKVAWINWKQCMCDIFFLDWPDYNLSEKEQLVSESGTNWNKTMVAREWSSMQTKRRVNPGLTVTLMLVTSQFTSTWQEHIPSSQSYKWALGTVSWWIAYSLLLAGRWMKDKVFGAPTAVLPKLCSAAGVSLLVFQEEHYAHYVHGRNDDSPDARALMGPLSSCRVMCAPQLRVVYKQLSMPESGALGDLYARRALLSKFLAAFFERALDGMSWVASERTLLERLLDVEITARESATTSALLYDDDPTPSCFLLTWWGEEWSLGTAEAMLFGCVLLAGGDCLLASLITLIIWQISLQLRHWFGRRKLKAMDVIESLM